MVIRPDRKNAAKAPLPLSRKRLGWAYPHPRHFAKRGCKVLKIKEDASFFVTKRRQADENTGVESKRLVGSEQ